MNRHKGTNFDDFLKEEGIFDEAEAVAIKRILAYQIQQELKKEHMTKMTLAKKLKTSRAALDRLLNPTNTSVTLHTMVKTAHVLGKKLTFSLAG